MNLSNFDDLEFAQESEVVETTVSQAAEQSTPEPVKKAAKASKKPAAPRANFSTEQTTYIIQASSKGDSFEKITNDLNENMPGAVPFKVDQIKGKKNSLRKNAKTAFKDKVGLALELMEDKDESFKTIDNLKVYNSEELKLDRETDKNVKRIVETEITPEVKSELKKHWLIYHSIFPAATPTTKNTKKSIDDVFPAGLFEEIA